MLPTYGVIIPILHGEHGIDSIRNNTPNKRWNKLSQARYILVGNTFHLLGRFRSRLRTTEPISSRHDTCRGTAVLHLDESVIRSTVYFSHDAQSGLTCTGAKQSRTGIPGHRVGDVTRRAVLGDAATTMMPARHPQYIGYGGATTEYTLHSWHWGCGFDNRPGVMHHVRGSG